MAKRPPAGNRKNKRAAKSGAAPKRAKSTGGIGTGGTGTNGTNTGGTGVSPVSPRAAPDAEREAAAFYKRSGRSIKLLTVQEILDEEHVQKM